MWVVSYFKVFYEKQTKKFVVKVWLSGPSGKKCNKPLHYVEKEFDDEESCRLGIGTLLDQYKSLLQVHTIKK